MSVYRARWVCPTTGLPRCKDFNSKPEAEAFKALPRDNLVFIKRVPG